MAYVHLEDIGITGIAVAVPKNVINNRDLAEKFGKSTLINLSVQQEFYRGGLRQNTRQRRISDWRQHKSY